VSGDRISRAVAMAMAMPVAVEPCKVDAAAVEERKRGHHRARHGAAVEYQGRSAIY
jgi:hypothetical protein